MNKNRAVIYLRLSKEDLNKLKEGDESSSIKNQRLMLTEYALAHEFHIVDVYSDDDESGLYDDRPGFEQMIEHAKLGKMDVIIAKSQSRFSRNMEHIERYLHHDFPLMGIRFIGVADNADTNNIGNKKARQINGLVNEWYCEDLSNNIRTVFKAKMKDGQFLGSSCPYGYVKNPENHNQLLIDDYAAEVVRRIYALYMDGNGKGKIASILSEEGILIPTKYKQEVLGINYKNSKLLAETKVWSYQTVHTILKNPVYKGTLVQNKYNKASYKDKKKIKMAEDAWIVAKDTHEPIIDSHTFDLVQELQKRRTKSIVTTPNGLLSGKLYCADCKKSMERQYARRGDGGFIGYVCKTYKTLGKKFCPSHNILNEDLERIILKSLKCEAQKILKQEDIDELQQFEVVKRKQENREQQLTQAQKQIEKLQRFKKGALEKFLDKVIIEADYNQYIADYDNEIKDLRLHMECLSDAKEMKEVLQSEYLNWINAFKNYINIDRLDRRVVVELINKIEVYMDGAITIHYKFRNPYEK